MTRFAALVLAALPLALAASERPAEIDPNTRIQGGADVRGSGANAGAGAQSDNRIETDKSAVGATNAPRDEAREAPRGDERGPENDKPTSERKPLERESEDAAKGASSQPQ